MNQFRNLTIYGLSEGAILALAALDGMSISDEGDCSGVLGGFFAALSLGGTGLSPKGSSRNCSVSSAPVSSWSLGGVGGRTERASNLDTMAMLEIANKRGKQKQKKALASLSYT